MKVYDNEEYKDYVESLSGEYRDCYNRIEAYIKVCYRGKNDSEEQCVFQILGELISAQKNCLPLSSVIGNNIKEYCDKYIDLYQEPNAKLINVLQTSGLYAIIILIIIFVKGYKVYSLNFANNLTFSSIELIALIYSIYWSVIRLNTVKLATKYNKKIKSLDILLNVVFILVIVPLINVFCNLVGFEIKIPFLVFIAFIGIVALLFIYINKLRKAQVTNE